MSSLTHIPKQKIFEGVTFNSLDEFDEKLILFPNYSGGQYGSIYLYNTSPPQIAKVITLDTTQTSKTNTMREIILNQRTNHSNICTASKVFYIEANSEIAKLFNEKCTKNNEETKEEINESEKVILLMEFCSCNVNEYGNRLRTRSKNDNSIDVNAHITALMKDAVSGVGFLHGQEIMHRDIKDNNLLISMFGDPKLVDHGFARPIDKENCHTSCRGTPGSIAPENYLVKKKYDQQADMWSVGSTWAKSIGFKFKDLPPVPNEQEIKAWIAEEKPKLEKHLDDIKYPLKDELLTLISYDPQKRLTSKALLQILTNYIDQQQINVQQLKEERIEIVRELAKENITKYYTKDCVRSMSANDVQSKILKFVGDGLDNKQNNVLKEFLLDMDCDGEWMFYDKEYFTNMFSDWNGSKSVDDETVTIYADLFEKYKINETSEHIIASNTLFDKIIKGYSNDKNDIFGDMEAKTVNNNNKQQNAIFKENSNHKSRKRKHESPTLMNVKTNPKKKRKLNDSTPVSF